jgi:hypothetical protein
MAYDEDLADRVRDAVPPGAVEKPMFGGLGFMVGGHLTVALGMGDLMVRVGSDAVPAALERPGAGPCAMGERTMKDWVLVDSDSLTDDALADWVGRALSFVTTLPAR